MFNMNQSESFLALQTELSEVQRENNKKSQALELLLVIWGLRYKCHYFDHILNGCVSEIKKTAEDERLI